MKCVLVSHSHWDREWYRTFQSFRARLVDLIDRVLELIAEDAGFRFLLDGQTIVIEDYLEIRPGRRADLEAACRAGRLAIGPWYVQPDSLLPSGEAHVRNLLEGRRVGAAVGPVSRVAYCPDSFGHPAQLPQLFRGFGLGPFIYWRGGGDEVDSLPAAYLWTAPDGTAVLAHRLAEGYFAASGLPLDPAAAARVLAEVTRSLAPAGDDDAVLLMNGFDHALPEPHAGAVAEALARATGWTVVRGLLEDFAALLPAEAPRFRGELLGARTANLLPGVWSARLPLKLRNRRAEALLEGWAEPWAALGRALGAPDERPALRAAWRALLQNQAHDSIGGCSQDRVHEQMGARYDAAEELASETATRALERIAGLGAERRSPWGESFDLAVFNPSPHPRTDVVRFAPVPRSWIDLRVGNEVAVHPWLQIGLTAEGYTVDGQPARLVVDQGTDRIRLLTDVPARTIEFVAADVPAFGWRRFRLAPSGRHPEQEDASREVSCEAIAVSAGEDGTLAVRLGDRTYSGLAGIEDVGDRGDAYDFDPVRAGEVTLAEVRVRRRIDATGIRHLLVSRVLSVPASLAADRRGRSTERVPLAVETDVRLVPGAARVDLLVQVTNAARDHRLRLLFPTGSPVASFLAATTFDVGCRRTERRDASRWVHPAPSTFPHQGFVHANGLTVAAPGLPEAEVAPDGVIAVTLVRAVGWLARMDLRSRPRPAGPLMLAPGAQCLETIEATLSLFAGLDPRAARDAEFGLRAVAAGDGPLAPPDRPLLEVSPREILVSALKPAAGGPGLILRLLNPTDGAVAARITIGFPVSEVVPIRLDETPEGAAVRVDGRRVETVVPPHGLRSLQLVCP